ncbi:Crp/Fnr family transcriptional regulator [Oleisolibacter albus]|uniref:Crp/Fnr family transcriptional regulator n=1 Tax=Oleisolibacter albus TaxID=2171757 RepID=UPI000DF37F42|nr:Crp/Fnr family transcriptional regulator [Oleisolibacter albus]
MSETPQASLDRITLLQALAPEERANIARQCKWRHFHPGEQIIDRSSDSRDVCLIVEGRVQVVNYSLSGREITFDDVDAGGYLGELSAIDGAPRSASVIATTETLVAFMSPRLFQETVTSHPDITWAVMKRLASIVRSATGRIMDLSTLGANNRVHAELLRLAKAGLKPDNRAEIIPVPIHSDIASRVSTTRETVARVMSDLARDGLVERQGNSLLILDYQRLEEMVEDVRGD